MGSQPDLRTESQGIRKTIMTALGLAEGAFPEFRSEYCAMIRGRAESKESSLMGGETGQINAWEGSGTLHCSTASLILCNRSSRTVGPKWVRQLMSGVINAIQIVLSPILVLTMPLPVATRYPVAFRITKACAVFLCSPGLVGCDV